MENIIKGQKIITNACKQAQKTGVLIIPGELKTIKRKYFEDYERETQDFYHDTTKELIIQEGIEEISDNSFSLLHGIRNVSFPRSLKTIGFSAFSSCYKLEKIKFPENIEVIGGLAFLSCRSLREVIFPDNCRLKAIKDSSFMSCKIREITLPDGIEVIGDEAFALCYSLEKVIFPSTLKTIGKGAFGYDKDLEQVIITGDNNIMADETAFEGCRKLNKIPNEIRTINYFMTCQTTREILENKSLLEKFGKKRTRFQNILSSVLEFAANEEKAKLEMAVKDLKAICLEFPKGTISSKLLKLVNEINEVKTNL